MERKNIDLPVDVLKKLSEMAVEHGKSLKAYIESILISKANLEYRETSENPSPSGDVWFDNPENLAEVREGIAQYHKGETQTCSLDEVRERLGL